MGQLLPVAPWARSGRREAHRRRQVYGDAGGRQEGRGRHRGDTDLLRFPRRALDAHPHQQRDRAAEPCDPPPHPSGGDVPDGNSALMLVCARLRYVAGTRWGNKKYMNMKHLETAPDDISIAG